MGTLITSVNVKPKIKMGLFFKKTIKFGPVNVNLSKSGVGVSIGVKGVRVGHNAKRQNYIDAGLGPVRYRKVSKKQLRK